jgi:hypothetical protein
VFFFQRGNGAGASTPSAHTKPVMSSVAAERKNGSSMSRPARSGESKSPGHGSKPAMTSGKTHATSLGHSNPKAQTDCTTAGDGWQSIDLEETNQIATQASKPGIQARPVDPRGISQTIDLESKESDRDALENTHPSS